MKRVHRELHFGTPQGADVSKFLRAVVGELRHRKLGFLVRDGIIRDRDKSIRKVRHEIAHCIFALGLSEGARRAALKGDVGKWTQRKIRNPRLRSPLDRLRAGRRRSVLKEWREEHRRAAVTVMFDSVELDEIPESAPAVAGYIGGNWPTFDQLEERFPGAERLSIAVASHHDADCLDIEPGDATPADAPAWVRRQIRRGVERPVVYASASQMDDVLAELDAAGIPRTAVRIWTAHYTFAPHICGPASCGELQRTKADATQWTNRSMGRNLDESLVSRAFFR